MTRRYLVIRAIVRVLFRVSVAACIVAILVGLDAAVIAFWPALIISVALFILLALTSTHIHNRKGSS